MKSSILLLAIFIASFAISQSDEFTYYQLDTKEPIKECKITAYVDNLNLSQGNIESIIGSILTLRVAKNTDYNILINGSKVFTINNLGLTSKEEFSSNQNLIYHVQIGAFSKSIPNSCYSDFEDIIIENGDEITRLMIGTFSTFAEITSVKNLVQNKGYTDAFIVAYYKGERINFSDALIKEEQLYQVKMKEMQPPNLILNPIEIASSNSKH